MVRGLQQLTIAAALLEKLCVVCCFFYEQAQHPVISISVPQLKVLKWADVYDPRSMHLGKMEHLRSLCTFYLVYGPESFAQNHTCLMLMSRFKVVECLSLALAYIPGINNHQYLMEDMTMLPDTSFLHLILNAKGHSFGACSFHVLRLCPGIKRLMMDLSGHFFLEAQDECPQDCICGQPSNWKTDELMLNGLHEVEIQAFRGSEHELVFVKRLLTWATALKRMTVSFNRSVSESMSMELCQVFRNFCKPEIRMEFCVSEDG
ncbi:unnamed protein product [Urochloa decumbens]|uniref:FBD domain-containing protein n=1 Tax=Urochloa decumbens TaxID=240449 RepID=A0ABC9FLC1_9POAL